MKVLITTVPFGNNNRLPLELLKEANIEYLINPLGKKLTEQEIAEMVTDFDVIIAGTEPITDYVMNKASNLKMISRVGIGLDSVDLLSAERLGINISYTPDAPAPAVAELTMGLMLSLLRSIHLANVHLRKGRWHRYLGRRIADVTIGIIGVGRIGSRVIRHTKSFGKPKILANDLVHDRQLDREFKVEWVTKEEVYRQADVVSIHVPLTVQTKHMIKREQLEMMKPDAMIINTSRGGVICEEDLYQVLQAGHLAGVALDVFEQEPYSGNLQEIERCLLTAHMGSMSVDCRTRMEIEATEEAIRFHQGKPLESEVPAEEYEVQRQML